MSGQAVLPLPDHAEYGRDVFQRSPQSGARVALSVDAPHRTITDFIALAPDRHPRRSHARARLPAAYCLLANGFRPSSSRRSAASRSAALISRTASALGGRRGDFRTLNRNHQIMRASRPSTSNTEVELDLGGPGSLRARPARGAGPRPAPGGRGLLTLALLLFALGSALSGGQLASIAARARPALVGLQLRLVDPLHGDLSSVTSGCRSAAVPRPRPRILRPRQFRSPRLRRPRRLFRPPARRRRHARR